MTKLKAILAPAAGALIVGAAGYVVAPSLVGHAFASERIVVAAEDATPSDDKGNVNGSAKMGEDEGTHTGPGQGATPEDDTQKIDQPARRNPTTDNSPEEDDEAMPPDEDEAAPSDGGEDSDR